jgi:hypothetical protein
MRRSWLAPRAKVTSEAACRVCGSDVDLQSAHTIGRAHDPDDGKVRSVDTVPLCIDHHLAYDAHRLDLLPYLTTAEQAAAVEHVGIVAALRRLTSTR